MKISKVLLSSVAGGVMLAAGVAAPAQAADPVIYTAPAAMAVPSSDVGFNWNRFYAGVYGVAQKDAPGWRQGVGIDLGVNTQMDMYVLGGELAVHGLTQQGNYGGTYGQVLIKAGVLVTDNVLAYAAGGFGMDVGGGIGNQNVLVGGGLEMAVTDSVSLRGQYLYGMPISANDTQVNQISIGANYHF